MSEKPRRPWYSFRWMILYWFALAWALVMIGSYTPPMPGATWEDVLPYLYLPTLVVAFGPLYYAFRWWKNSPR